MKMTVLSVLRPAVSRRASWVGLCLMSLVAGCRREDIRVYTAPKDAPTPPPRMARGPARGARPSLSWKLPNGWRETGPGEMSLASFAIGDGSGPEAQVSITPLGHLTGHETMIVNMWRQQVGLPTNSEEEVAQQLQPVEVGGEKGSLFEVTGKTDDGGSVRIVTAMVHRSDASWFFKLAGDAALVAAQKPVFIEFLKSVLIRQAAPADDTAEADASRPVRRAGPRRRQGRGVDQRFPKRHRRHARQREPLAAANRPGRSERKRPRSARIA